MIVSPGQKAFMYISVLISSFDKADFDKFKEIILNRFDYQFLFVKGQAIVMPKDVCLYRVGILCNLASVQVCRARCRIPWFDDFVENAFHSHEVGVLTLWSIAYSLISKMGKLDMSGKICNDYPFYGDLLIPNCVNFSRKQIGNVNISSNHIKLVKMNDIGRI